MQHLPLREGYIIDESKQRTDLLFIEDNELANIQKCLIVICPACNSENRTIQFDSKFIKCENCGRKLAPKNASEEIRIGKINAENVVKIIHNALVASFTIISRDDALGVWKVITNDTEIYFAIPEISSTSYLVSSKFPIVFVLLDHEKMLPLLPPIDRDICISLFDLSKEKLNDTLIIAIDKWNAEKLKPLTEIASILESFSPSEFERFSLDLFNKLKENGRYLSYLRYLFNNRNTIINSKPIKLGGPSLADFQSINIHDYMKDAFNPDRSGEVKRYSTTKFSLRDYEKAIRHAADDPLTMIVSTNSIQRDVWQGILTMKMKKGYYHHVLVDKELLLSLIIESNLIDFLKGYPVKKK